MRKRTMPDNDDVAAVAQWRREVTERPWLPPAMCPTRSDEARLGRRLTRYAAPSAKQMQLVAVLGTAASPAMRASATVPC